MVESKCQDITKVIKRYSLGTINVRTKFEANPCSRFHNEVFQQLEILPASGVMLNIQGKGFITRISPLDTMAICTKLHVNQSQISCDISVWTK